MNTWVISDIHGCYRTLRRLLQKLPIGDPVVFAGDLIDRGPDSKSVVQFAMEQSIPTVMGNHEHLCLYHHQRVTSKLYSQKEIWIWNGGSAALDSFGGKIPKFVLDWMGKLPLAVDLNGCCRVSHTGHGTPDNLMTDASGERMVWDRDHVFPQDGRFRIFGHTQEQGVVLTDHWAKIDTGAAYTHQGLGTLTAFCWPTKQIVQQRYDETPL